MKKITLIAYNKQGATVEFSGKSKADALRKFRREYSREGWKIEYHDEYGNWL